MKEQKPPTDAPNTLRMEECKSLKEGDKVYFISEKKQYTIISRNERYLVCTYPAFGTVVYSIVDLKEDIRGTHNYIFNPFDLTEKKGCDELISRLVKGECEISSRNNICLDFDYLRTKALKGGDNNGI